MSAERFSPSLAPRYRAHFVSAASWARVRVTVWRAGAAFTLIVVARRYFQLSVIVHPADVQDRDAPSTCVYRQLHPYQLRESPNVTRSLPHAYTMRATAAAPRYENP
jgi:hypothetical protein